ncbi:MAG: pseudaminic acid synthase [Desulfobacterales bacterium]|uniref:Pseudaminic acid synthase n=1 Tax=Candidatus Desulfatibia vada TaxID=2841696 RepID=A0A8J6P6P3_9BACT|nr:pseudaminic acid synthase [Candidatus Desulfatibia vada]
MNYIEINGRRIGAGHPIYIIAEMSANHGQDFERAVKILEAAKEAGADAVKLQTFTPDTHTLKSDLEYFRIDGGTPWDQRTLYDLYTEAYMPWEWQPKLMKVAQELGLDLFSTAVDPSGVDFLERMGVAIHKTASFEIVDLALIEKMARTGKPLVLSTGMATLAEIEEAVGTARDAGATQIALLKCTSAYPAPPEEMNLRTLPHLSETFGVPVGLSDHTLGIAVPIAGIALGVSIIEKHFTVSRAMRSPDSSFSLEPHELKAMVDAVRTAEKALGTVHYGVSNRESRNRVFRRSLFVVEDVKTGDLLTSANVRSIRPGYGLLPRYLKQVLGRHAVCDTKKGTPLSWDIIAGRRSDK